MLIPNRNPEKTPTNIVKSNKNVKQTQKLKLKTQSTLKHTKQQQQPQLNQVNQVHKQSKPIVSKQTLNPNKAIQIKAAINQAITISKTKEKQINKTLNR